MRVVVRILGVGPDVVLDQGSKGWFSEVAVAVDSGVDQQSTSRRRVPPPAGRSWPPRRRDAVRCDGHASRPG